MPLCFFYPKLFVSEIVSVAKKCVSDHRHPEIGAVISALEGHVRKCESQAGGAYNTVAIEVRHLVHFMYFESLTLQLRN